MTKKRVDIRDGAPAPMFGDVVTWDGEGWVPSAVRSRWSVIGPRGLREWLSAGIEGPDIDIHMGNRTIGRGGDKVLLFDSGGEPVSEFAATDAGLTAALAAMASGDVVWLPAISIDGDHTVPAGGSLLGREREASKLTGRLTLGAGSSVVEVTVDVADSSPAVTGPGSGTAYLRECYVRSEHSGAGEAIGLCLGAGGVVARDSHLEGTSASGNGYGIGFTGAGWLVDIGNRIIGSTSDVETESLGSGTWYSYDSDTSLVECGCSGGNGSACGCSNPIGQQDDVCANGCILIGSSNPTHGTAWVIYDLGAVYALTQIVVRWYRDGDDWIHGSTDGVHWTEIHYSRNSWSGQTCHQDTYDFSAVDARFLRFKVGQWVLIGNTIRLAWFNWSGTMKGGNVISAGTLFTEKADDVVPGWSAQGAWDVAAYGGARHASDLEAAALIRHLPLPQAQNDLALVNTDLEWSRLAGPAAQYDVLMAGADPFVPGWGGLPAAALPDHTHAGAGQGGTITHAVTTGQTADDHHSEVHVVSSTGPHAETGLTAGHVLRVSGAAAFSFAAIQVADLPAHDILSASHGDTLAAGVSRGSIIYGNATPAWAELVHPGTAYHLQTDANDVLWAQDITMAADATVDGLDLSILGDALFTKDAGLALWGPGCKIADDKWTSTRGQEATITGAFHQEAGPWAESRGFVVEQAGVNEEPAPRMIDGNSDGLADGWAYWDNFGSGGSATQTVVAHPVAERGWLQRFQYTAAAGDAADNCLVYDFTAVGSFAQGDDVTVSIDTKGELSGCAFRIYCCEADVVGVAGTCHTGTDISLSGSLRRENFTFTTVDADCSRIRAGIQIYNVDNGDSFDVHFGAVNCEKADYATSFMHGGLDWCAWSAGADQSTTTRVATTVNLDAHVGLVSGNDTLTFAIWAQMPDDHDATWPFIRAFLWDCRGANDNNRSFVGWNQNTHQWDWYINGGYRVQVSDTFDAGDWKLFEVTFDYANDEYKLSIDGVEVGSSSAVLTAPTGLVDWQIGSKYGGNEQCGFTIAEFAALDSILTANEIAAQYASGKPLADAGAMTVPHADFISATFQGRSGAQVELARDNIPVYGTILDDETAAVTDVAVLEHQSRGTVAADFGAGAMFRLEDGGGTVRDAMRLGVVWEDAGAAENAEFELRLNYNGTLQQCGVIVGPNGASADGNQRGLGAVDWQGARNLVTDVASGGCSTVSGGLWNMASGYGAVVGGGGENEASGYYSVVAGGNTNRASASYATVPGGWYCRASGDYSLAAGYDASATHDHSMVFSASAATTISWGANTWTVRCHGGARFYSAAGVATGVQLTAGGNAWAAISTRASKENFGPVEDILSKIAALPIYDYNLKSQSPEVRHVGPVAEDFNDVFGFTEAPLRINMLDIASVGLAGVKALDVEVMELRGRVAELESLLVI